MERDPVRYVWAATRRLHLAGFVLILVAVPVVWFVLDLVRAAIDDCLAGIGFSGGRATVPFLRYAIALPERIREEPLVLLPGWSLSRGGLAGAVAVALVALALVAAILSSLLGALKASIRERVTERLRRRILDAVVSSRAAAAADARRAAALAGEGMAREDGFLGGALITPVAAVAALLVSLLYVVVADPRLVLPLAGGLALLAFTWPGRIKAARKVAEARIVQGAGLRRSMLDLVRRLPALRAHGTGAAERQLFAKAWLDRAAPFAQAQRHLALISALAVFGGLMALLAVPAFAALVSLARPITPGQASAAMAAGAIAFLALERLLHWRRQVAEARPVFEEIGHTLGRLQSRGGLASGPPLPEDGAIVIEGVAGHDPGTGARLARLDAQFDLHAHVALVGAPGSGAPLLAAMLGGRIEPTEGRILLGSVDLGEAAPEDRSRRIAYAGGATILVAGSLRQNLLYGCNDADTPDIEARLIQAVVASGLDYFIQNKSLSGTIDVLREPALAGAIVEARAAVREALAAAGRAALVDPFEAEHYNRHATVGENIFFGVPLGDTFREANLPSHSFVREILRVEGLADPLAEMGLSIASSMIEMFADLPEGSPLFERFAFFPPSESGYFEDLIRRQQEKRRGTETARDRDRLIALALPYCESRHRLGLLKPDTEARLLRVRAAFAAQIPASLRPTIEFFDAGRISHAASVLDNLLFGRVAQDRAGAEDEVRRVLWRVLSERGLVLDMFRIGLETRIDQRGSELTQNEIAAIDVARCLLRRAECVVIEHALDGLRTAEADLRVSRLRQALAGRGLVLVTSELSTAMDTPPFASTIHFQRGAEARIEERA